MMETENPGKSALALIGPPDAQKAISALAAWDAMAQGAYSKNTRRAWQADGAVFQAFCEGAGLAFFPASPLTLRQFIEHCMGVGKRPATVRRYLATIARAHLAAELTSPCASEPVRLALKEMGQKTSARQHQARPLGWAEIEKFIETAGNDCGRIGSGRYSVWPTTPWRAGASSWRSMWKI